MNRILRTACLILTVCQLGACSANFTADTAALSANTAESASKSHRPTAPSPTPTPVPTPMPTPSPTPTSVSTPVPTPAATATPATAPTFTVSAASSSPTSVQAGQTVLLKANVMSNIATSAITIDLEVRNTSNGTITGSPQNVLGSQSFVAEVANGYSWNYTTPPGLAAGTYCFVVAGFDSTWTKNYFWNSCAAQFTVTAAPTPTPAPTAAPTPVASATPATGKIALPGANLSGGEYQLGNQNLCADVTARINDTTSCIFVGWDYIYPSNAEVDYYSAKGMKVIRVPFDANRIQLQRNGALNAGEIAKIDAVVSYAASKGLKVLLDPHNYGYLNEYDASGALAGRLIGVDPLMPASKFADFWSKMAAHYISNSNVLFGLMNEPHDQTAAQWKAAAVAAVNAIRATGATNKILIPGTSWTGAHSWVSSGNAAAWAGFSDPNFAFEVHQYLDSDSSGTHDTCAAGTGSTTLVGFSDWARSNHVQGFLGEFGWANNSGCATEANALVSYMTSNSDVFLGYTYWSGGQWLGTYMYSIEPTGLGSSTVTDKPQYLLLQSYF